jgi:hypothetical protein
MTRSDVLKAPGDGAVGDRKDFSAVAEADEEGAGCLVALQVHVDGIGHVGQAHLQIGDLREPAALDHGGPVIDLKLVRGGYFDGKRLAGLGDGS